MVNTKEGLLTLQSLATGANPFCDWVCDWGEPLTIGVRPIRARLQLLTGEGRIRREGHQVLEGFALAGLGRLCCNMCGIREPEAEHGIGNNS